MENTKITAVSEEQEEEFLLALATERMTRFDPTTLITQAQVDAEFGFVENK